MTVATLDGAVGARTARWSVEAGQRRRELAEFLRNRRERRQPGEVGIRPHGLRRTPGLRREEVAELAGISTTWYTWLEQGREMRVSRKVLRGLADAFGLDPVETAYLFRLAGQLPPAAANRRPAAGADRPAARFESLLLQLEPSPAFVTDPRLGILAWNRGFEQLYGDPARLPAEDRNMLWLTFTSPEVRALSVDWEADARCLLGQFRTRLGGALARPEAATLVARLEEASADFRRLWSRMDVEPWNCRPRVILHPRLGRIETETVELHEAGGVSLIAYLARPGTALWRRFAELLDGVVQQTGEQPAVGGRQEGEVAPAEHHDPAVRRGVRGPAGQGRRRNERVGQPAERGQPHPDADLAEASLRLGAQGQVRP
jgi:transcriptional regulator with XRE-family HTH domain